MYGHNAIVKIRVIINLTRAAIRIITIESYMKYLYRKWKLGDNNFLGKSYQTCFVNKSLFPPSPLLQ